MAAAGAVEAIGERRKQWRRIDRHWRNSLAKADDGHDRHIFEIETLEELRESLRQFHTDNTTFGFDQGATVADILAPALENFRPFVNTIESASGYPPASALVWKGASKASLVLSSTIDLLLELSEIIPSLDWDKKVLYRFRAVQYGLQDIFKDYVMFCTQHSTGSELSDVSSRQDPRNELEEVKERMHRHDRKLRSDVAKELQSQEAKVVAMLPDDISHVAQMDRNPRQESKVEFPVTTVQLSRNNAFVGRLDLLDTLAKKVDLPKSTVTTPTICVLHGLGGVGKTQAALQFYYEHRQDYLATFWLEAEHDWTLAEKFGHIAGKLDLLSTKTTDRGGNEMQTRAIEEGRMWLQTTEHRWLVIFDNVESFKDLDQYLPTESRCNGTILITTQLPDVPAWMGDVRVVPVEAFSIQDAANCLFKYLGRKPKDERERTTAVRLAEHVGCLPLAMATIGGYIQQSPISLDEFYESIQKEATVYKQADKIEAIPYGKSLITVFTKAIGALQQPARELLNVLAFLHPDSVPEAIFVKGIEKGIFRHIKSKIDLRNTYFELNSRQLIRRETAGNESYVSVHRVVQWNVLLKLSEDYDKRWRCFKQAFDMVSALLPKVNPMQTPKSEDWPPYAQYGRQILELRMHCLWPEPPVRLPMEFAQILTDMATYIWFSGKFPEGEAVLETAGHVLDDNNAKLGHPLRTNIYSMHGIITSYEGVSKRKESMQLRQAAYLSRKQNIGQKEETERTEDENIMYWQMHSDMAFAYIQEEDFEATADFITECQEQYKSWHEKEEEIPFEYAKYHWLISFCHMANQQPVKSIAAITRCLELIESKRAAGKDHPMTQLVKFCTAVLLWHTQATENRQKALEIHKAVLEHRRRLLGEFSQFTLESYSTCGKLCCDTGEYQRAREYLTTCLERRKRAAWNEEGVARAQHRYVQVLRHLARGKQAKGDKETADALTLEANRRAKDVSDVIKRYRKDYQEYLPKGGDASEEENLDQMVSFWAGRFTGGLLLISPLEGQLI